MTAKVADFVYWVVGAPPDKGAGDEVRLRWIRRFYSRLSLPLFVVLLLIIAVTNAPSWIWFLLALSAVILSSGFLALTIQIRRSRQP